MRNIYNEIKYYFKTYGLFKTIKKIFSKLIRKLLGKDINSNGDPNVEAYRTWMKKNVPTRKELKSQRKHKFNYEPKISIIVPLYNTPIKFFKELVDYLIGQTYTNWELCLADGSPEKNEELIKITEKDNRIKYKFIGENKGISGNTNEALDMATGDFVGLLDHDDLLPKYCLYEIVKCINENPDVEFIYTDEDKMTEINKPRYDARFKPDFAIDTLRSNNYICHFSVFKNCLIKKIGGFRSKYDGAQDYDIVLRATEQAKKIVHIPKILYHWRVHPQSTAMQGDAKPYAFEAGIYVLEDHLKRVGLEGTVSHGTTLGTYKIDYKVKDNPKVTILIPNYNEKETLEKCINSILGKTTYKNYEIVVIENNSTEESIFNYYKQLLNNDKVKILNYNTGKFIENEIECSLDYVAENKREIKPGFNYSAIINFGVKNTDGEYIVQLNNDTEILTKDWLEKMVGMNQREDVGIVGTKLYYPDDTIQHAGIIIGVQEIAGQPFKGISRGLHGYFAIASHIQNLSAVTAACMMSKREVYEEVDFMNEKFAVAFNDIDFCLKVIKSGKKIIYNPFVELYHYESKSRGFEDTPEKMERFRKEIDLFNKEWGDYKSKGDPYYNKNFSLETGYIIREDKV